MVNLEACRQHDKNTGGTFRISVEREYEDCLMSGQKYCYDKFEQYMLCHGLGTPPITLKELKQLLEAL